MVPKTLKTPLRYPGGKSRAVKRMFQHLPEMSNIREYREGFVGGGSVALAVSRMKPDIPIWVNDLYTPLYNFWSVLKDHSEEMHRKLMVIKMDAVSNDNHKQVFLESKHILSQNDWSNIDLACRFYVVNKCSFSGLTESSSFSKSASQNNFTYKGIRNLLLYPELMKNWTITNCCYSELLCNDPDVFVYLDPPYDIKSMLYGKRGSMHKGFNHDEFAKNCNSMNSPTMISYNYDKMVTDRFPNWRQENFDHTYTMRSTGSYSEDQSKRKELLLLNYE